MSGCRVALTLVGQIMKKYFKIRIKQANNEGAGITGKFLRAKRVEEQKCAQRMRVCDEHSYGDFQDTIQHGNDIEEDTRCNEIIRQVT